MANKDKVERKSYLEKRKQRKEAEDHEDEIINISKTEQAIENNFQKILLGVAAIIALAAIFIFINNAGKGSEKKAQVAAIEAQNYFNNQNWQAAIDGDGTSMGFQAIADEYGKTNIGNLAHYYVGVSYMKTGEYEKALAALKQYKATNDPNVNGLAFMNMGDASMELGNTSEAADYYKKAANSGSEAFGADFLLRYGMLQLKNNDTAGAKASFEKITENYSGSTQSNTAEQYLAGL